MPFTPITLPSESAAAYTPVAADGSNGNKFQNDGKRRLQIFNPDANSITLTIVTPRTVDGNAVADRVIGPITDTYYYVEALNPETYNVQSGTDQDAVTMTWAGTLTNTVLGVT